MFFRVNTRRGVFEDIPVDDEDWVFNADTDIAVCRLMFDASVHMFGVPLHRALAPGELYAGQAVFFVGLFSRFPGERSVDAIVRSGTVALPDTRVPVHLRSKEDSKEVDAHLIESRSWGGESGSPVFLHEEYYSAPDKIAVTFKDGVPHTLPVKNEVRAREVLPPLLGLLHGHFEIPTMVRSGTDWIDANSGIGVVIPSRKIYDTLMNHPRLVKDREELAERIERKAKKAATPRPDRAPRKSSPKPFTESDFEAALKKVSRKLPQSKAPHWFSRASKIALSSCS